MRTDCTIFSQKQHKFVSPPTKGVRNRSVAWDLENLCRRSESASKRLLLPVHLTRAKHKAGGRRHEKREKRRVERTPKFPRVNAQLVSEHDAPDANTPQITALDARGVEKESPPRLGVG